MEEKVVIVNFKQQKPMKKKWNYIRRCGLVLLLVGGLSGCTIEESNRTKVRDLEYSILAQEEIPAELLEQIEEKKAADFKLTYETPENFYIIRGYGEQATGGYCIQVRELYLSNNAVFFETELIGPRKGENISKSPSFPYIVVQTEKVDKNIVFE